MTRVLTRARGTLTIVTRLPGQSGAHYRSRDEVEAARDARVRSAARYAAQSVPYYRDLLVREGIDAREVRTVADLRRLPVVERAAVQAAPAAFRELVRCDDLPAGPGGKFRHLVPLPRERASGIRGRRSPRRPAP